jgi:4'-phosphopantetheinyl transferase EntD
VLDEENCRAVANNVLDMQEFDCLQGASELPLAMALTIAFSAKESLFKAAYVSVRKFFNFSAARVLDLDVRKRQVTLALTETLSKDFVRGKRCVVGYGLIRENSVLTYFGW